MPIIPNSMDGFFEVPASNNVIIGERANFRCNHSAPGTIGWQVNDSSLTSLGTKSSYIASRIFRHPDGSALSILTIKAISEFNQSSIRCLALFDGAQAEYSPRALLQIQGPLDAVKNLEWNSTIITWEPPFSLDLNDINPDIIYCVEVYNITCGEKELILGECNLVDLSYNYSYLDPAFIYVIAITPRNNVDSAENGTRSKIQEQFVYFQKSELNVTYEHEIINAFIVDVMIVIQLPLNNSDSNHRWPLTYALSLASSNYFDVYLPSDVFAGVNSQIIEANITLPLKRLWNIFLLAYGCKENVVTERVELSTHEFQWQSFSTSHLGVLKISGYFIDRSEAIGLLTVAYQSQAVNGEFDISYILTIRSLGNKNLNIPIGHISNNLNHMLAVSIFTVEKDGLPFSRSVSSPRRISATILEDSSNERKILFDIQSFPSNDTTCITCTFLDSSTTDCVAVVHQRISQLNSSGLMNIESSHKFNRSGDTAYGCIEKLNTAYYQIGVINGKQVTKQSYRAISICKIECIVGSVLGGTLALMSVFIISAMFASKFWAKRKETGHTLSDCGDTNIEINKCAAYDVPSLVQQKVFMENNPAYEEISHFTDT